MCNSNKCAICECSEDEIPAFWKKWQQDTSEPDSKMFGHILTNTQKDCPTSMDEWCAEEENDRDAIYVNLVKNQESYTAYDGKQIWNAIYQENCMIEKI
jgi:ERO1-like protein alpha